MNDFFSIMNVIMRFIQLKLNIYGYMISVWDIILFTAVSFLIIGFIKKFWG